MAHGEVALVDDVQGALAAQHSRAFANSGPKGDFDSPLGRSDLELLDDVLIEAERVTGLRFSAYIGNLGSDTRAGAEGLLTAFGEESPMAVLLAVSPGQRVVEVVTGAEASRRVSDRGAKLAVLAVVSSCAQGEVANGIVSGLRILADQAGTLPDRTNW